MKHVTDPFLDFIPHLGRYWIPGLLYTGASSWTSQMEGL